MKTQSKKTGAPSDAWMKAHECPNCEGVTGSNDCPECNGDGFVENVGEPNRPARLPTRAAKAAAEKAEAIRELRGTLRRGSTVYTKLLHVSRSGTYRALDVLVIRNNEPLRITWSVAKALGYRYDIKHEGVAVPGCGMDMGFHLIHGLSYALHGFDNHNGEGPKRSGYTLVQRWL